MGLFQEPSVQGLIRSHSYVVAERNRPHEMHPANAKLRPKRRRGRHDRTTWMRSARGVIVVAFIGMSQLSVRERRVDRSAKDLRGDHSRNLLATNGTGEPD